MKEVGPIIMDEQIEASAESYLEGEETYSGQSLSRPKVQYVNDGIL